MSPVSHGLHPQILVVLARNLADTIVKALRTGALSMQVLLGTEVARVLRVAEEAVVRSRTGLEALFGQGQLAATGNRLRSTLPIFEGMPRHCREMTHNVLN